MAEFSDALIAGKQYEKIVLAAIRKKYPNAYIVDGYCKECDIEVPEKNLKIEVKSDLKSNYTGNLVVEIEMFGVPSALLATKSDYWVFCDGAELMWITPSTIKNIIIWNDLHAAKFIGSGDEYSKRAFLIRKELIREESTVNLIEPEDELRL